ncbi:hypothetical protein J1N35_043697 [Gossypium stocksii]|uniref:Uncharacterized protein n=1 Tax=Gossypium stocksii TaxID=47602 RepID=A0A9D3ZFP4_9ROSI|nr:hypothetical protein J1N35_043697 [Gossypium stocksii]
MRAVPGARMQGAVMKQKLQRRGVKELTKAMTILESLIELVLRKNKFKSSNLGEKGNGGEDYEEE